MEVSKAFQRILTKQGIQFKLDYKVVAADKSGPTVKVEIESVKNPGTKETVNYRNKNMNIWWIDLKWIFLDFSSMLILY